MIQLTFQPALDPFHTIFRLLRLRPIISRRGSLPRDEVRILDFYLLFPFRMGDIRLLPKHRKYKSLAGKFENAKPYGEQPDDEILFARMEMIQKAGLETLAKQGFIDPTRWSVGEVMPTIAPLAAPLDARIKELNSLESELLEFLETLAQEYALLGQGGLKDRTALLEYRYDSI